MTTVELEKRRRYGEIADTAATIDISWSRPHSLQRCHAYMQTIIMAGVGELRNNVGQDSMTSVGGDDAAD